MRLHSNDRWAWLIETVGSDIERGKEYYFQQRLSPPGFVYVGSEINTNGFYMMWWDLV